MSKRKSFSQNMNLRAKELSSTEKEYIEKQEARKFKEKRTTVFSKEMLDIISEYALSQRIEQEEMNLRVERRDAEIQRKLMVNQIPNSFATSVPTFSVPVLFKVGDLVRHKTVGNNKVQGVVTEVNTLYTTIDTSVEIKVEGSTYGPKEYDVHKNWTMVQPGYGLELEKKRLAEKEILKDPVKRLSRMRHSGILNKDKE